MLFRPAPPPAQTQGESSRAPEPPRVETTATRAAAFDEVYKTGVWGRNSAGQGISGSGSSCEATVLYRVFLQQFMQDTNVEVGGRCRLRRLELLAARRLDRHRLQGLRHRRVSLIQQDKQRFAKPNIQFFQADIVETDLPPADSLISLKHVLQHLPNADVQKFLAKQLPKYKYVLLTDGVDRATLTAPNVDIPAGLVSPARSDATTVQHPLRHQGADLLGRRHDASGRLHPGRSAREAATVAPTASWGVVFCDARGDVRGAAARVVGSGA